MRALDSPTEPLDLRATLGTLVDLYSLHIAPLEELDGAEAWQHHPAIAALKQRLEPQLRGRLDVPAVPAWEGDAAAEMRRMAVAERVPPIYDWLAEEASVVRGRSRRQLR